MRRGLLALLVTALGGCGSSTTQPPRKPNAAVLKIVQECEDSRSCKQGASEAKREVNRGHAYLHAHKAEEEAKEAAALQRTGLP